MKSITADSTTEAWLPIPEWELLYEASTEGRVRSLISLEGTRFQWKRGGILKPSLGRKGYLQLRLCRGDGTGISVRVHRLVAAAFIGPRPDGMQINHKDGIKTNNTPDNLEYATCRENIRHGWGTGLYSGDHQRGEKNTFSKLTAEDVIAIRRLDAEMTRDGLAEMYGVSTATISHIVTRKTWKHI